MHLSWVRDGIFVIGMDNEMQIYSQWKDAFNENSNESFIDDQNAREKGRRVSVWISTWIFTGYDS